LLSRYTDGIEIAPVASLQQAIHVLTKEPARALLINDISIGDALQRLDEHVELPYGTPAIVCSVPGIHEAVGGLGVSDYLVKPIARETLLATLGRLGLEGKTVLIIDDQLEALRLFRRMLISEGGGYRILQATNGQQGMRILREQGADAVLLDLVMPRMDGFRFLAEKSQDPTIRDIPVVVISACDPAGQPVVSNALAVTRKGGLSVPQLLSCIDTLSTTLAAAGPADDPMLQEALSDSPALG
jgi:CheY-like chemotaxis protein